METHGTQGADVLIGTPDADTIYGFGGNDTLNGGPGDDVLAGMDGADTLNGGDGDDYLLGGAGNDTLDGGAGNDWAAYEDATSAVKVDLNLTAAQNTGGGGVDKLIGIENLYGSAFNDTLIGDAGANMLGGGDGNDSLTGGKGDDTLNGGAGNDTVLGGDGDDYIFGGPGNDTIDGGAGSDWSAYEDATSGVTVNLNLTTAQNTGGGGTDKLISIENVYGSAFDDVLTGDGKDNTLAGGDGDDRLIAGAGDDHLSGGWGSDYIDGGAGFDVITLDGGEGLVDLAVTLQQGGNHGRDTLISIEGVIGSDLRDDISGNAAENYIYGAGGDDYLIAIGGGDVVDGGDGNDLLRASQNASGDYLTGGAGNDAFFTYNGWVTMDGGEGDDRFFVDRAPGLVGVTTVDGGAGVDTLELSGGYVPIGGAVVDLRILGPQDIGAGQFLDIKGVENLIGGPGNDHLIGDTKDNVLQGREGDDILDGGAGVDTVSYLNDGASGGVTIDLRQSLQARSAHGQDTLIAIENIIGTAYADRLTGDAGNNVFTGGAGDDVIDGGEGVDFVSYLDDGLQTGVTVNLYMGWQSTLSDRGQDTLISIEGVEGSAFADFITGSAGNDVLRGNGGNDVIWGYGGYDTLEGGDGDDYLSAYVLNNNTASSAGTTLRGGAGRDTLELGLGDNRAEGDEGDDVFYVNNLAGLKIIAGGDGVDSLQFSYRTGGPLEFASGVTVDLSLLQAQQVATGVSMVLSGIEKVVGSMAGDHITGSADDNILIGFDGNDVIGGGLGEDTLDGGAGSDTLTGGKGRDVLWGGADKDHFVFAAGDSVATDALGNGVDVIMDFKAVDQLVFGSTSVTMTYGEAVRGSYVEALALAQDSLAGALTEKVFTAVQVGSDVFVFSGARDATGAHLENVVKLVGVGIDEVAFNNFR